MNNGEEENSEEEISFWTWDMDLAFQQVLMENELREHMEQFERNATGLAGQTAEEVKVHHELPVEDVCRIESGCIPSSNHEARCSSDFGDGNRKQQTNTGRKKHTRWTADEHNKFLLGLAKCGRGDWRGISRQYVKSKTPSQVASHAQKYFLHQDREPSSRRKHRRSIHDTSLKMLMDDMIKNSTINGNPADQTHGLTATGYPEIQSNESINEQLMHQTIGPANICPSLNIDMQMDGSSLYQPPLQFHDQLSTLPSMQPAATWSALPSMQPAPTWSADWPCHSVYSSSLPLYPHQAQQEEEDDGLLQSVVRSPYSLHNPNPVSSYDPTIPSNA